MQTFYCVILKTIYNYRIPPIRILYPSQDSHTVGNFANRDNILSDKSIKIQNIDISILTLKQKNIY